MTKAGAYLAAQLQLNLMILGLTPKVELCRTRNSYFPSVRLPAKATSWPLQLAALCPQLRVLVLVLVLVRHRYLAPPKRLRCACEQRIAATIDCWANGIILHALSAYNWHLRRVLPGNFYSFPASASQHIHRIACPVLPVPSPPVMRMHAVPRIFAIRQCLG